MIKFKQLFIAAGVASLAACAPKPLPVINVSTAFDIEQAKNLLKAGTNTIKGSGLMRQVNGGVITCAGQSVHLLPATRHAQERMRIFYGNTTKGLNTNIPLSSVKGSPPEYFTTIRTTTCDAQGYFIFDKVARGNFYITTSVSWGATARNIFGDYYTAGQGGALMHKVTVGENEIKEIVLSP